MNLNFYNPHNANSLQDLQSSLQEQINKLNELKNISLNTGNIPKVQSPLQEQRYLLDCGNKEDWDDFLRFNYNLTEYQIFEDYKLFLQAKQEVTVDKDKEKLESMKERLSKRKDKVNNVQSSGQQQSVQPVYTTEQSIPNQYTVQHTVQPNQQSGQQPIQYVQQPHVQPNQQLPMQVQGNIVASNTSVNTNQNANSVNVNKLAKDTRNFENKGDKHAR